MSSGLIRIPEAIIFDVLESKIPISAFALMWTPNDTEESFEWQDNLDGESRSYGFMIN